MTAIYNFFIDFGFIFELVLSFALFTFFFGRRKLFWLRLVACIACLFAFSWLRDATPSDSPWWQALKYMVLYATCLGSLFFLFSEPARNILFAFIGASLTQHCAFKLGDLVRYVIAPQTDIVNAVVYCGIVIAVNLFIYIFLARRRQGGFEGLPLTPILALGGAMLVVCVLFQQLFEVYGEDGGLPMYALFSSFDFIATLIILCLLYAVLQSNRMRQESRMTEHLLYLQQAQMEASKETINLINIKCHDLKKMIGTFGEKMHIEKDEVEELRRAINIYDGAVKTGNEALEGGYKRFAVKPLVGGGITSAKAALVSPYGKIESSWQAEGGKFTLHAKVPMGTVCELTLPNGETKSLASGSYEFTCAL